MAQHHPKLTSRAFSPSENSAFQLISSGREVAAAQFQPGKMVTSTPVKNRESESLAEARQRRAQHFRNCFNPPALSTFQPGQSCCCLLCLEGGGWVVPCPVSAHPTLLQSPRC